LYTQVIKFKKATCHSVAMPFPFLDLYTGMAVSVLENHKKVFQSIIPELRLHVYSYAIDLESDPSEEASFVHLTQTCRQIRAEFRPIYMAAPNSHLNLQHHELEGYLDAFLSGWNLPEIDKSGFMANIVLVNGVDWRKFANFSPTKPSLIVPLLQLLASAPQVHITTHYDDGFWFEEGLMQSIFDCRTEWGRLFENDVIEDIKYHDNHHMRPRQCPKVQIQLKRNFVAPWVKNGAEVVDHVGAVEFVQKLGFTEELCKPAFNVFMGFQNDAGESSRPYRVIRGRFITDVSDSYQIRRDV
jgi:hypothetical protein